MLGFGTERIAEAAAGDPAAVQDTVKTRGNPGLQSPRIFEADGDSKRRKLKLERCGYPIFVGAAFGACAGIVLGLRSAVTVAEQDLYWLSLGVWVFPGAVVGAICGLLVQVIHQLMLRR